MMTWTDDPPDYAPPPGMGDDPPPAPGADGSVDWYAGPEQPRLPWLSTPAIFAPVPPVLWAVAGLQLAPGRPFLWAGYGAGGKTLSMQSLSVAAAAGRPIWGEYRLDRPLRVRHIDSEQGEGATRRRYKRLAIGLGIDPDELSGRLELLSFGGLYLTDDGAADQWERAADGCDLLWCDSLRALCPGCDENSSEIRRYLDPLTMISERTKCAIGLTHHAGKDPADGSKRDVRQKARGSSAIFDAAGCVYDLSGGQGEPRRVTQAKAPADAAGGAVEPFYLSIEDVPVDRDPYAGIRVRYMTAEEACPPVRQGTRFAALQEAVLEAVRAEALESKNAIAVRVTGARGTVLQAIAELEAAGKIAFAGGVYRVC